MPRRLRSNRNLEDPPNIEAKVNYDHQESDQPLRFLPPRSPTPTPTPSLILHTPSRLPGITSADIQILRTKQRRLQRSATLTLQATRELGPRAVRGLASTLIFAQHEAGTAVCIDPRGWMLTCAHCFGETMQEWRAHRRKWLLCYTGLAVQVECLVWDARRDLALAKVICIEVPEELRSSRGPVSATPVFAYIPLSTSQSTTAPIICIGQPGADDLESAAPRKTAYDLIEISQGRLCGMIPDVDPQDNSEIGSLKHDAWTYWGHSGAPLLRRVDGSLLGLHSSWDDSTAMRHGVPLVAIKAFLNEHLPQAEDDLRASAESPCNLENKEPEFIVIDSSD
ncbi:uncharacterized protein N7496_000030 [Penicillium cataractarum]|uniref:AT hook domain-containing protein n=1 Tax=Penicillium cataractarum TaxID=2100454 RepID=A0A9W9VT66_9EURO|nr:uncharacterized protein N7496_000030 [Penicillium cataractarum]KAJ5388962.1 hypothetical protein N7496_000030 [Penicillium cataractarum]